MEYIILFDAASYLGGPAINTALPAILPALIISNMTAAAFRAFSWPTRPCEATRGSNVSASTPRPRIWEWAAIRFKPRNSLVSPTVTTGWWWSYVSLTVTSAILSMEEYDELTAAIVTEIVV